VFSLGPGGAFAIEMPPNIEQFMSGSQVPLLFTPDSIIAIVTKGLTMPERRIDHRSSAQHAFCYSNVQLNMYGLAVQVLNCCGLLCDAYGMYENAKFARSCGCFTLNKYHANLVAILEFVMKKFDGGKEVVNVHVTNVTSKKFTRLLLRDGRMPVGLTAGSFNSDRRVKVRFRQASEAAIEFVNQGGATKAEDKRGWTVMGWVRRGKVADRGVDAPTIAGQAQKTLADSSDLIYHITSIVPTSDDVAHELAANNYGLLFDAQELLNTGTINV